MGRTAIHLEPLDRLSEKWPWDPEFLRLAMIVPAVAGVSLALALFPAYGIQSLWFLLAIPTGLLIRATFGAAGERVDALRDAAAGRAGESAEGLLVIGRTECPGVVILCESELLLLPIVGHELSIPLSTVTRVREGRWLPGNFVWGKRAFHLETLGSDRVAFAVPESIGKRWSGRLQSR